MDGQPSNVRLTFGKYKGLTIRRVPDDYLSDLTKAPWVDVETKTAAFLEIAFRKERAKNKPKPKKFSAMTKGKCRVCRKAHSVWRTQWRKAANPRCTKCGGMLDRVIEKKRRR